MADICSTDEPSLALLEYRYDALPPGDWIRLLHLLPGAFEDEVHVQLSTVKLETAPPFEGISYCWGDSSDRQRIFCGDKSLKITNNLYRALLHFRDVSAIRVLWADAVCIDQSNLRERGHQVALMGRLYSKTARVLVWLG